MKRNERTKAVDLTEFVYDGLSGALLGSIGGAFIGVMVGAIVWVIAGGPLVSQPALVDFLYATRLGLVQGAAIGAIIAVVDGANQMRHQN